jgi:hypothetical protein
MRRFNVDFKSELAALQVKIDDSTFLGKTGRFPDSLNIPIWKLRTPKKDSCAPSSLNRFKEIIYAVKISDKSLNMKEIFLYP